MATQIIEGARNNGIRKKRDSNTGRVKRFEWATLQQVEELSEQRGKLAKLEKQPQGVKEIYKKEENLKEENKLRQT